MKPNPNGEGGAGEGLCGEGGEGGCEGDRGMVLTALEASDLSEARSVARSSARAALALIGL